MKDHSSPLHLSHQSIKKVLFARKLRKTMTGEEQIIWNAVRRKALGCKWRRQVPLGLFIADFCCMKHRIIVEVDGGIHEEMKEYDAMRDKHLKSTGGFTIIRVPADRVQNDLNDVLEEMKRACGPLPRPLS
jgi:very-short-patch-repair endonuclease